jgi:hypothetical protein
MFCRALIAMTLTLSMSGCHMIMQDFTSKEYKFKVRFPGSPEEKQQTGPLGITMKMFMVENANGMYGVAVADMPIPSNESPDKVQDRLDGAQAGAIRNINGTLISSTGIYLKGYPGREFSAAVTMPTQGQVRAKIFIVNRRMYQVMVLGTSAFANSEGANEFLNSFQLLD